MPLRMALVLAEQFRRDRVELQSFSAAIAPPS